MPNYKFSKSAKNDLTEIISYTIENWGVAQSSTYIDGLEQLVKTLAESPALGKISLSHSKDMRVYPYQSHSIYYLEDTNGIMVVRVLHKKMNPTLHLKPKGEA